jgi:hypothetical protein
MPTTRPLPANRWQTNDVGCFIAFDRGPKAQLRLKQRETAKGDEDRIIP